MDNLCKTLTKAYKNNSLCFEYVRNFEYELIRNTDQRVNRIMGDRV